MVRNRLHDRTSEVGLSDLLDGWNTERSCQLLRGVDRLVCRILRLLRFGRLQLGQRRSGVAQGLMADKEWDRDRGVRFDSGAGTGPWQLVFALEQPSAMGARLLEPAPWMACGASNGTDAVAAMSLRTR